MARQRAQYRDRDPREVRSGARRGDSLLLFLEDVVAIVRARGKVPVSP